MNNHLYKIGQKVRHDLSGREFYIIGIKTASMLTRETKLIVHENKNTPSRNGLTMWPCHCTVIGGES